MHTLALLVAIVVSGCGTIDGTDPYALWRAYEHPDGLYHFHCLLPPWEEHDDFTAARPVLVLSPEEWSDPLDPFVGPNAKVRLDVWFDPTNDPADLAEERRAYWQENGYEVELPTIYLNGAGDEGVSQHASAGVVWVVELIQRAGNGAAIFSLWGRGDSDSPDLQLLMDGFEPRPSKGSL